MPHPLSFSLVTSSSVARVCTFCRESIADPGALAGAAGASHRICKSCLTRCFEVLGESGIGPFAAAVAKARAAALESELDDLLRVRSNIREGSYATVIDRKIVEARAAIEGHRHEKPADAAFDVCCSFCSARQGDVKKLVAGPTVNICDACIASAASAMPVSPPPGP